MAPRTLLCLLIVGCAMGLLQTTLASRPGVPAGHSGGFMNDGNNCTACHFFGIGSGSVELIGAPERYRPSAIYDLSVLITDPAQTGAGFEVSVEGEGGHGGALLLADPAAVPALTQFASDGGSTNANYITHTQDGYEDSEDNWVGNGGSYAFNFRWQAPAVDDGRVAVFVAAQGVNGQSIVGDNYYSAYATFDYAVPGDSDGDGDVDLRDFAIYQNCYDGEGAVGGGGCEYVDLTTAEFIDAFAGPLSTLPAGYVLADVSRGGLLYDKWWPVNGASTPSGDHPLYPPIGQQSGNTTYRCKECHGWDYRGRDGAYASGSTHFTDIVGVFGTTLNPQEVFDLLKGNPAAVANGHDMGVYGMTDADIWDVVKMTFEGVVDTSAYIAPNGFFFGNPLSGQLVYEREGSCVSCHGPDGEAADASDVARGNAWEFLHKVRFGQPASAMLGFEHLRWNVSVATDVGAYTVSLTP